MNSGTQTESSLEEGGNLSVANKLNGKTQALWHGEATLTTDAYRVLWNPGSTNASELTFGVARTVVAGVRAGRNKAIRFLETEPIPALEFKNYTNCISQID